MACLLIKSKAPTPSTESTVSEGSPSQATCKECTSASEPALVRVCGSLECGSKLLRQSARDQPPEKVADDDAPNTCSRR